MWNPKLNLVILETYVSKTQSKKVLKWLEYFVGITWTSLAKVKWVLVMKWTNLVHIPKEDCKWPGGPVCHPYSERVFFVSWQWPSMKTFYICFKHFLLWVLEIVVSSKSLPEQRNNSKISFFYFQITKDSEQWFRGLKRSWKYLYHTIKGQCYLVLLHYGYCTSHVNVAW